VFVPGFVAAIFADFELPDCAFADAVTASPAAKVPAAIPKKWRRR
jgi:hypothetical protein